MDSQNCKEHYIRKSNKIRRKTISLANKLFNNKDNVYFMKEYHMNELQTLDNTFYILEDKINYIQKLLKNKQTQNTNEGLKKTDIDKLLPLFCYYIYQTQNNNLNFNTPIDEVD